MRASTLILILSAAAAISFVVFGDSDKRLEKDNNLFQRISTYTAELQSVEQAPEEVLPRSRRDATTLEDTCGRASETALSSRVFGGQASDLAEWPWHVLIVKFRNEENSKAWLYVCGGTLIANQWVISAAWCFKDRSSPYSAILGAHHWKKNDDHDLWVAVGAILCHPDFDETTGENDICLAKLAGEVSYTKHILPACLPEAGDDAYVGKNCTMIGWGNSSIGDLYSTLQERQTSVVANTECPQSRNNTICTRSGVCRKDWGGPLLCRLSNSEESQFSVYGVAISRDDCNGNSVFTDVTKFLSWIQTTKTSSPDFSLCFDKTTIISCESTLRDNDTIIRSPVANPNSLEYSYPRTQNCSWSVEAPYGYTITIEFLCFLSLVNDGSYLKISSNDGTVKTLTGTLDVHEMKPHETKGDVATINFHSGSEYSSRGFVLRVVFVQQFKSPSVTVSSSKVSVTDEDPVEIRCTGSGLPIPRVKWTRAEKDVSLLTSDIVHQVTLNGSATLHLTKPNVNDEGQYRCSAISAYGGKNHSSFGTLTIVVPAVPNITNVLAYTCNSSLAVKWIPHFLAVGVRHRFVVYDENPVTRNIIVMPSDRSEQRLIIENLNPSTTYHIMVSPCSTENCDSSYVAKHQAVSGGKPPPASWASLNMSAEQCHLFWTLPNTNPSDLISGIKITITMHVVRLPPGQNSSSSQKSKEISPAVSSYVIPTLPNREHTVSIETLSCAGSGKTLTATGQCITGVSAPFSLPTVKQTSDVTESTMHVAIQPPDETNGPVSCVFIVIQVNEQAIREEIPKLFNSSSSHEEKGIYLAFALATPRSVAQLDILLGDDKTFYCDISSSGSGEQKPSIDSNIIIARNRPLSTDTNYRIYMVTTTPSSAKVLYQISDALVIMSSSDSIINIVVPLFSAIAACIGLTAIALVAKKSMEKRKRNITQVQADYTQPPPALPSSPPPNSQEPDYTTIDSQDPVRQASASMPFGDIEPPRYTPSPIRVTEKNVRRNSGGEELEEGPYETIYVVSDADDDYAEMRSVDAASLNYDFAS